MLRGKCECGSRLLCITFMFRGRSRKSSTQLLHSEHNVWPYVAKPQKLSDDTSVPFVVRSTQRLRLLSFSTSVHARSGSGFASTHAVKLQHAVNVLRLHVKLTCVTTVRRISRPRKDALSFGQSTSHFQEQVLLEVLHTKVNVWFGTKEQQVVNIRKDVKSFFVLRTYKFGSDFMRTKPYFSTHAAKCCCQSFGEFRRP